MITTKNTRSQALPFYRSKNQWFYSNYHDPNVYLNVPESNIVPFQFILGSGVTNPANGQVRRLSDDTVVCNGLSDVTSSTFDINYDSVDEKIFSFDASQQNFGGNIDGRVYIQIDVGGQTWYSEPFCMSSGVKYKLSWTNTCNKNFAYYDDGFTNSIWFKELHWNRPEVEKERETIEDGSNIQSNAKIIHRKFYSFTIIAPDYLLDAFEALEHHNNVVIQNLETGEQQKLTNIRVDKAGDEKEAYHEITVRYQIIDDEKPFGIFLEDPFTLGCCDVIPIDDVECQPEGGQGIDCTGFDVSINVSGNVLTYTLTNEPAEGTVNQTWFLDGKPIGSGSSVTMSQYGVYRVQVSKGNCYSNDEHTRVNPCSGWTVTPIVNGLSISANSTGQTTAVSYQVFDDNDLVVSSSLPYTAPQAGTYLLRATMGDCTRDFFLDVSDDAANHTAVITKNGTELTGSAVGCSGTLTHRWEIDKGNGPVILGSSATITAAENGLYIYYAICDGVEAKAQQVMLDICLPVQICNADDIKTTVNVTGQLDVC